MKQGPAPSSRSGAQPPALPPADHNIAELARDTGEYRPSEHRAIAEGGHLRVPGSDYDAYVESHVRRLEALRRAGIVWRADADRWLVPADLEARAQAYDASHGRRASLRILLAHDLNREVTSDGPTRLDRQLVNHTGDTFAEAGFGVEVRGTSTAGGRIDSTGSCQAYAGGRRAGDTRSLAHTRTAGGRADRTEARRGTRACFPHDRRWPDHPRQASWLSPARQRAFCHDR
ncbi:MAG: DUF3363 domain-containing protein [Bradyrhizobium sp.]|nr:DUF3363 domain-containing protein [Bradyrhizobium sp.]